MKLDQVGILLAEGERSQAYIQRMVKNKLKPAYAIIMLKDNFLNRTFSDKFLAKLQKIKNKFKNYEKIKEFNPEEPILATLIKNNIKYEKVYTKSCNDKEIIKLIKRKKEKYIIFTGGGILNKEILNLGKKFIHIHPGIVPQYRGSTCFYYSMITEGHCGATAFFMEEEIDTGKIIKKKTFQMPKVKDIDNIYDPIIRSDLLIDVLKEFSKKEKFKTQSQPEKGETYFIIHPVLKHIATLKAKRFKEKSI